MYQSETGPSGVGSPAPARHLAAAAQLKDADLGHFFIDPHLGSIQEQRRGGCFCASARGGESARFYRHCFTDPTSHVVWANVPGFEAGAV